MGGVAVKLEPPLLGWLSVLWPLLDSLALKCLAKEIGSSLSQEGRELCAWAWTMVFLHVCGTGIPVGANCLPCLPLHPPEPLQGLSIPFAQL